MSIESAGRIKGVKKTNETETNSFAERLLSFT